MNQMPFSPTNEQLAVIDHAGSAFVTACPGAGKTRVMVERARRLCQAIPLGRGVAFLSFTQAAVSELETRLRKESLLPDPVFPSFIGTFDSFVWQFLVAPYGLHDCQVCPRLIPDIGKLKVVPYPGAHELPLSCFCRQTGTIIEENARRIGFDVSQKKPVQLQRYETAAQRIRTQLREQGKLDFHEARTVALERVDNSVLGNRISTAVHARFVEVIVDEAQDCNPDDLAIISWLRDTGMPVKVICDPHQTIYEFRGGVTDHLLEFKKSFADDQQKELTGNFRSSPNICNTVVQLRPSSSRGLPDTSLGPSRDEMAAVQILSYEGRSVPASVGETFRKVLQEADIDMSSAPIVAATRSSAAAAVGQPRPSRSTHRSIRLAEAVTSFHFAAGFKEIKAALGVLHQILLELEGHIDGVSYHQYLIDNEMEPDEWRPKVISILRELQFDPAKHANARAWHTAAKALLSSSLSIKNGQSISQMLRWNDELDSALSAVPSATAMPRTIHSVKGMEFPSICVITTSTLKGILDYLEDGEPADNAEEARKLYVAASRAERLLVIAVPRSQAERLSQHLSGQGAEITIREI